MAALCAQIGRKARVIRNIQILDADFTHLVESHTKIQSTIMNAYGAVLQHLEEQNSGHAHFCVFSSWLGPLISGEVREGRAYSMIEGHIDAAVCYWCVIKLLMNSITLN